MTKFPFTNLRDEIETLTKTYRESSTLRPEVLFRDFLPTGYRFTTLTSVDGRFVDLVIFAKIHLGMIVTLYDDLADHPRYYNPELLQHLYKLNVGIDHVPARSLALQDQKVFNLARYLFQRLTLLLQHFPHYKELFPVLRFDLEQFYISNKYSELMTKLPAVRNLTESRLLGPYNMGMVAAGTIDLMASSGFDRRELGTCREIFILGQRAGRISNLLFTLRREISEGDLTNEILMTSSENYQNPLHQEFADILTKLQNQGIQTFSTAQYATGLQALNQLHQNLEGQI